MAFQTSLRPSARATSHLCPSCRLPLQPQTQVRHATLLKRPKRPYTFTQLVTLSDGSTYTQRTTSPQSLYKTTKDTRNSLLWNPSSQKLLNVEEDEAGRLKRFRGRFGRGWDSEVLDAGEEARDGEEGIQKGEGAAAQEESLLDLISGYGQEAEKKGEAKGKRERAKGRKEPGGEK